MAGFQTSLIGRFWASPKGIVGRYRDWIAKLPNNGPDAFVFPNEEELTRTQDKRAKAATRRLQVVKKETAA